jgi:hypothetical protein
MSEPNDWPEPEMGLEAPPESERPSPPPQTPTAPAAKPRKMLPRSMSVLMMGLFSMFLPILGVMLASITLVVAQKPLRQYLNAPEEFVGYGNLNAGRVMAVITFILHVLAIVAGFVIGFLLYRITDSGGPMSVNVPDF